MIALAKRTFAPALDFTTLGYILVAGLAAAVAFDAFGQWLSPALGYARLSPAPLAAQSLQVLFGPLDHARQLGEIVHYLTGLIAYPIGYAFIALPFARSVFPRMHWSIVATVYGVALWVFALYVMAHLVAGNPPFLGFSGITWVALIGHVLFALVLGAVLSRRIR